MEQECFGRHTLRTLTYLSLPSQRKDCEADRCVLVGNDRLDTAVDDGVSLPQQAPSTYFSLPVVDSATALR